MIDLICGARPNFMKIDPVVRNMPDTGGRLRIVHTGQHYDGAMSESFFRQLSLPEPDVNLEVGSASVTTQTARIMIEYERFLLDSPDGMPDLTVVVGDVNSTLACSLVAARHGIPVAHVEAGLRSFDLSMPEELNRMLTDQVSSLLLMTSPEARDNLAREGRRSDSMVMVGNPMIDTMLRLLPSTLEMKAAHGEGQGLVTLHRPSNVDDSARLTRIVDALGSIRDLSFVFPAHPRTMKALQVSGLSSFLPRNLRLVEPMDYLSFIRMEESSPVVITDSGGVQEETSVLGVPCVTLRPNTERPITLAAGTNVLCPEPEDLRDAVGRAIENRPPDPPVIPFWDGRAGERICAAIDRFLTGEDSGERGESC